MAAPLPEGVQPTAARLGRGGERCQSGRSGGAPRNRQAVVLRWRW